MFREQDIKSINKSISSVLRSGWLTSGPLVARFESEFKAVSGTRFAIALSSATAALHTIAASLSLKARDEVIVPANTFASTANAALYVGAKPALADCDLRSFNVTAETIERCITPKTKAVIVTHIAGNPCEMEPIISLCRERDLVLSEDVAHASGGKYKGKLCGSLSYAGAHSFYPTKIIAAGEGGMIGTNSKPLADFARTFRNMGREAFGHGPIVKLGYNYRMSDIHAAIGLSQLHRIGEFIEKRNRLARRYSDLLGAVRWTAPQEVAEHSRCTYYSYIIRLLPEAPISRDGLSKALASKGIETTVMFTPLHKQPYFERFFKQRTSLANAESIGLESIALPMHAGMVEDDVDYVVKAIKEA